MKRGFDVNNMIRDALERRARGWVKRGGIARRCSRRRRKRNSVCRSNLLRSISRHVAVLTFYGRGYRPFQYPLKRIAPPISSIPSISFPLFSPPCFHDTLNFKFRFTRIVKCIDRLEGTGISSICTPCV